MEVKNRTSPGYPREVDLAPGPDGKAKGSIKFAGNSDSYVDFPNSAGQTLDVRYSMTMLCWLYPENKDGHIFRYKDDAKRGVVLKVQNHKVAVKFRNRNNSTESTLTHDTHLGDEWMLVGASYDNGSGDAKLWIDGALVKSENIGSGLELATQGNVKMGKRLKGKITQMQVYNLALTQEQIQTIRKRNTGKNMLITKTINIVITIIIIIIPIIIIVTNTIIIIIGITVCKMPVVVW